MKIIAVTQARSNSTRLPNKVLKKIQDKPLLQIHVERILKSQRITSLIIATTTNPDDDVICKLSKKLHAPYFRGSEEDVLDRFYQAVQDEKPDYVVRLTSDCPLIDGALIDKVIDHTINQDADYGCNVFKEIYPDGQDIEVMKFSALEKAYKEATKSSEREHVTPYIRNHSTWNHDTIFTAVNYEEDIDFGDLRMTVDESSDFELIQRLIQDLGVNKDWRTYAEYIESNPEVKVINASHSRNAGATKSYIKDMRNRYQKSTQFLERACKTVPLGSQTFSKSKTQLPYGVSPYFATHGEGVYLWDVDGNKYIDFVNGLASITLGYNDPDVKKAVAEQLEKGTIFSLPHELEFKVAEKICELVPCAEMVRFGKNGSDATAGAIRLARAYTEKDHVFVCGYHGWQDWYIGNTARNMGVPKATQDLTHSFSYNDIESLENLFKEYEGQVASVILEPVNVFAPKDNFLEKVKQITHDNGAVLIFDETVTGFRYSKGGAQEFYNVTPDLATFGKGLANGYPVSAIAGRTEIMKLMEEIFFSFTFGGETLSLAASLAVLEKLEKEPVIEHLNHIGTKLIQDLTQAIEKHNLQEYFSVTGYPIWSFFIINSKDETLMWQLKTLLLQEMFDNGIFMIGTHNLSYAHTEKHMNILVNVYEKYFEKVHKVLIEGFDKYLFAEPLEPLFKIR